MINLKKSSRKNSKIIELEEIFKKDIGEKYAKQ
jgi:hypothetical protein